MKPRNLFNIRYLFRASQALTLLALGSACSPLAAKPKPAIQITPLTPSEKSEVLAALQTGAPIPVDADTENTPPAPSNDCADFQKSLPNTFTQGYVQVPEDWSNPDSRKIRVFYYARLENIEGKTAQPVVFFNGGPAGDSHSSYQILEQQKPAHQLSFIYIDQRGTGCSDPFPVTLIDPQTARRLALYGSRSIVLDAEVIREKLLGPHSRWHAFGQSYGGYIVHRYIEVAPRSLSGAFAHGSSIMSDSIGWLSERLLSQKRVIEDYFANYPADREVFKKLKALIPSDRCYVSTSTHPSRICGPAILDGFNVMLGFHDSWYTLHRWSNALLDDPGAINQLVLNSFVRKFVMDDSEGSSFAAAVISQTEIVPGANDQDRCREASARLESQGESPSSWAVNECRVISAIQEPWTQILSAPTLASTLDRHRLEVISGSLTQYPDLQFFLYSGEKDTFVPMGGFKEEVARLGSRVQYRNFPTTGHEGFYSEQQIWTDLLSPVSR